MSIKEMTSSIVEVIASIPKGKVLGYGQVAALAGYPRGARQVVRILHTLTDKHDLPWHRVLRSNGEIALPMDGWGGVQKELLLSEGVVFVTSTRVNLSLHRYTPDTYYSEL